MGGDLFPEIIDHCRQAAGLEGIDFAVMDIRDLSGVTPVDITVVSAVLFRFPDDEFRLALDSLARVTKPGGWIFGFDLFHPFEQTLTIGEKSALHPEGLALVYRPYSEVSRLLEQRGFRDPWFTTFDIPIDLPKPTSLIDINTYTVKAADGYRLNFRGSLFLPWCHWGARKLGS
jgi:SAM-dependent methyltransferase